MSFRRNFDAEAIACARGKRPVRPTPLSRVSAPPADTPASPEDRELVIGKQDRLLAHLLTVPCSITPDGGDWIIRCRTREATEQLLSYLKINKVHGVIRRYRPGDYPRRREPPAP